MLKTTLIRRFFVPRFIVTGYYFCKYRAFVSTRAEVEMSSKLSLGSGTAIGSFCKVKATNGPVLIGGNCSIATCCSILAGPGGLHIGDDVMVGPCVTIVAGNLKYDRLDVPIRLQGSSSKGIRVGSNVWIGANCSILDGATIGDGAVISANSVVSGAIPANAIAMGNPAKVIFTRR